MSNGLGENSENLTSVLHEISSADSYKRYLTLTTGLSDMSETEETHKLFEFSPSSVVNQNYIEATEQTNLYPDLQPAEEGMQETDEIPTVDPQHEMKEELQRTEEEILTLRQVLAAKERYAAELRKKLGITAIDQISQSLKSEINKVQSSTAYQQTSHKIGEINEKVTSSEYYKKTSDTLKNAGTATASAFSSIGSSVSQRFTDMKNSPTFKSFEEKVEGVGSTLMSKVTSGSSVDNTPAATPSDEATPSDPITKQPEPQAEQK